MPTINIPCTFVGSFKVGDNLVYNCQVLSDLVASNVDSKVNKSIFIQVGSILEAALIQIIYRAQNHNIEGVPNIVEADRREIEGKKVDKFSTTIDVLRKYEILNGLGAAIYDDLHRLRKIRNKVHIQDEITIADFPRDEHQIYSDEAIAWAIELNARILTHLSENFARPAQMQGYVGDLTIPN